MHGLDNEMHHQLLVMAAIEPFLFSLFVAFLYPSEPFFFLLLCPVFHDYLRWWYTWGGGGAES